MKSQNIAEGQKAHYLSSTEILASLNVEENTGLTSQQVAERQIRYGMNILKRRKARSIISLIFEQFRSVIVWLLVGAAILSFIVGDLPEGFAILCVLIINAIIGFVTSWRAARTMEALYQMTAVSVRVRRNGRSEMIAARELVPGDIVQLDSGDIISADMRMLQVANLNCDESALTGESIPVAKSVDTLASDTYLADRINMGFSGTAVVGGAGTGIVVTTGMETELGHISALVADAKSATFPLERRLDKLAGNLVWISFLLAGLIAVVGIVQGMEILVVAKTAIALAVAAVPEGLPVVATLALARGMLRLAHRNVLIEKLSAVETLGATTIILTDKTGTLTENRMTVAGFLLDKGDVQINDTLSSSDLIENEGLRAALEVSVLCNAAEITDRSRSAQNSGVGDPMELALLNTGKIAGLRREKLLEQTPEILIHAFEQDLKMMATVHEIERGYQIMVKGAPEAIMSCVDSVLTENGVRPLSTAEHDEWLLRVQSTAGRGYRLIGLARKLADKPDVSPYEGLTLIGFVSLLDPLRADVPTAIAQCQNAGVRVVMMTGDHIATATEIAVQAGIADKDDIFAFSEKDLKQLADETVPDELREKLLKADVFARVSPETKQRLVTFYQNAGHVVAMTGDGVNDAPALKKADIGIAMGQRGTQIAREAAAMILCDDAFASILTAMKQGRVIFSNIKRFVIYLMSCNLSEVLVVGIAIFIGLPVPLTPLQILFLNLVTDIFPAFALGLGEDSSGVMKRPPRDPEAPMINKARWIDIAVFGSIISIITLGVYWMALNKMEMPQEDAATIAFLTLAMAQLWHVFNMRGHREGVLINSITINPYVWGALILCISLLAGAVYLPVFADILDLSRLPSDMLLLALEASLLTLLFGQAWVFLKKRTARSRAKRQLDE